MNQDTVAIEFVSASGSSQAIGNITQLALHKDFFTPSNALSFTIEDNRYWELLPVLQRGQKVRLSINGKPNFLGYIFAVSIEQSVSGTSVKVECKDVLEFMAQSSCLPNMGTNKTSNYHFPPTTKLKDALTVIAATFSALTSQPLEIQIDDHGSLTFATGFEVGFRHHSGGRSASINRQLNHLTTPSPGETYLAYFVRLIKMAGCNVKMSNSQENVILVAPPTYDRTQQSPYTLYHYLTGSNTSRNNVLDSHFRFNYDNQPSVVIIQANGLGDPHFTLQTVKGVAINELTAYEIDATGSPPIPIDTVDLTLQTLVANAPAPIFNQPLFNLRQSFPIDLQTDLSLPYFTLSCNGNTGEECAFAASKHLAECQDKYVEFMYHVSGWTNNGVIWQPNMMISITEELFSPGIPQTFPMWIKSVTLRRNRTQGTTTELVCTLPYTHNFEITQ